MNTKIKTVTTVLLVNGFILAVGILVLELVFGSWLNKNAFKKLNITRSASIRYDVSDLYLYPHKTVPYTRDAYGLRGFFDNPSAIDILTVGGSTTDQRYIADHETWQAVLEQQCRLIGKNIVVANAGVSGQSTFGHIKNFEWWFPHIPRLKPRYILFYVGINDLYKEAGAHFDTLSKDEQSKQSVVQQLKDNSALIYLARTIYGICRSRFAYHIADRAVNFAHVVWTEQPLQTSYDEIMEEPLKAYAERLEILINKTRLWGAVPVFVTQPSRIYRFVKGTLQGNADAAHFYNVQVNGVDFYHMMSKLNRVTAEVCRRNDCMMLDMAQDMVNQSVLNDDDFYDLIHMTPQGTKKVGIYLFEKLAKDI